MPALNPHQKCARLGQKAGNAKHHFNLKNNHYKREPTEQARVKPSLRMCYQSSGSEWR